MYKIIALIGKSGSGKDTLLKGILKTDYNKQYNEIIHYTTRPKREHEKDGVNYIFKTDEEYNIMKNNNIILEDACFNNWHYFITTNNLKSDKINIGVFSPKAVKILKQYINIEVKEFYIYASDKNRLIRQLNRENNPNIKEIIRRYQTDLEDFKEIESSSIEILNNDFSADIGINIARVNAVLDQWG